MLLLVGLACIIRPGIVRIAKSDNVRIAIKGQYWPVHIRPYNLRGLRGADLQAFGPSYQFAEGELRSPWQAEAG